MARPVIRAHIEIEGLAELQRDLKRVHGQLPKALGEFHREIGEFVIGRLPPGDPNAVGRGSGATVRASSTKREVLLRVGHGGREKHREQWGRIPVQPFAAGRPYIVGVIEENEDEIRQRYLDGIVETLAPAFYEAE